MYGAIIGDIVGSTFEFHRIKHKNFLFFDRGSDFTDDTVMTVAVANALLTWKREGGALETFMVQEMQKLGRLYPNPAGAYGHRFKLWLMSIQPKPYKSCGNGSAMRASACGLLANTLEEALSYAYSSAVVTHNHPEGIKGAQATAAAIFLAKIGSSKEEIREYIEKHFYPLNRTWREIHRNYGFSAICQDTVPEAIISFLESADYEDAIRNAIALGGDADTLAAICGSIAWTYYRRQNGGHLTAQMRRLIESAEVYIPDSFRKTVEAVEELTWGEVTDTMSPEETHRFFEELYHESERLQEMALDRFREAHKAYYETALKEIRKGKRRTRWMWYIFPQLQGLGHSPLAKYYAIQDREEALRYWEDPVLSDHLKQISAELLKQECSVKDILGSHDYLKLQSCMTLFYLVSQEPVFKEVLDKFYEGRMDAYTQQKLS